MTRSLLWRLILIAVLAVGIRLAYQAGMESFGGNYNNGSDSGKYIGVAHLIVTEGIYAQKGSTGEIIDAPDRLPFYPFFLAATFKLSQSENLRLVVTIQALLESLSVFAIGLAALAISSRMVMPAALMAALIPNFIVQTSYILQENLFLVFFTWGLCALLWAARSKRPVYLLALSGSFFGLALLTRLALAYYGLFLLPALFYALFYSRQHSWLRCAALAIVPTLAMYAVASPLLVHNYLNYGYVALSSQSGNHLLNWFYGCLASVPSCANRKQITAELRAITIAHIHALGVSNPFEISTFQSRLAIERILQLPLLNIIWGMTWGPFKTLIQTGFYEVLSQFNQPITFFSAAKGENFSERIYNFLSINRTNYFMISWAVVQLATVVSRFVQFCGLVEGIRRPETRAYVLILLSTIIYILLITGPVSSPRYRIPAEPPLILLFALGLTYSLDYFRARREKLD